jgi:hypothetical protein
MEYQTFITARLNNDIANREDVAKAVYDALRQFNNGEWGKVPEEDKEANNRDLKDRAGHVLARYETPTGDIYINLVFSENPSEDTAMIMYCDEY